MLSCQQLSHNKLVMLNENWTARLDSNQEAHLGAHGGKLSCQVICTSR